MQEELIVIVIYLFKNLFCLISLPIIISDTASFLMLLSWEDSKEGIASDLNRLRVYFDFSINWVF